MASKRTHEWYGVAQKKLNEETDKMEEAIEKEEDADRKDIVAIYRSMLKRLRVQEHDPAGHLYASKILAHVGMYTQLQGDRIVLCLKKHEEALSEYLAPLVEAAVVTKAEQEALEAKAEGAEEHGEQEGGKRAAQEEAEAASKERKLQ